ncbi:MAG: nucleoside phosphorylase [Patescibacteria group bacterium]
MVKSTAKMPAQPSGAQYHINCKKGDLAPFVLLPGDPGRVAKVANLWDKKKEIANHREYHSMTGEYNGTKISCLSTGIGSPSTAIAVEEAARIGCHTFIRIGTTGAIQSHIKPGDLIINTAGVRLEGTSHSYVDANYPAFAHYEVILALIEACEKLKFKYHLGITASTDAFYVGEGRPGFKRYDQSRFKHTIDDLQQTRVTNLEMEASALFTIANLYGLRAGSVCAVIDNVVTGDWKITGEKEIGLVASEAVAILAKWDKLKEKNHKKYFFPSLLK